MKCQLGDCVFWLAKEEAVSGVYLVVCGTYMYSCCSWYFYAFLLYEEGHTCLEHSCHLQWWHGLRQGHNANMAHSWCQNYVGSKWKMTLKFVNSEAKLWKHLVINRMHIYKQTALFQSIPRGRGKKITCRQHCCGYILNNCNNIHYW